MKGLPLLLLLAAFTILPMLHGGALPLIEVWVEDASAKQVAISSELMAYLSENGTLVITSDRGRLAIRVGEGKLVAGRDVFLQEGNALYLVTAKGLERVMGCERCSFYPYSRDKIAIVDSKGLLLISGGEKRRLRVRGTIRWSDDGSRLSVISGDELLVVNAFGSIVWRKDMNTQLFDAEPDDLTYVCMKGCEVYAINDKSFVAWTNKLCKCCIPGKLDRSGDHLFVLIQGKELAVLNARNGRRIQSLSMEGYEIDAIPEIVAVRDGDGRIHVVVDARRVHIRGESGGVLISWDVPSWLKSGELTVEHPQGRTAIPVGSDSFVPIPVEGDVNVTLRGFYGEVSLIVEVRPLNVTATPFGDIRISGDGVFEVEVDGRRYVPPVRVDTGWLPTYTLRVYNHGVLVAESTSINARFLVMMLVTSIMIIALLLWRVRSRS
ncbi:MAG: hypothetical protein QI197_02830 [Candidatus Korarchaeota archaeon]|nr:hypothetical protein [Candidatus Korarchaeota archaeon]